MYRHLAITAMLLAISASAPAFRYGLNTNAPINPATGGINASQDGALIAATGTATVRINAILGPWTSPTDTTRRGPDNLTWFETYDRIVDGILAEGIDVYLLIGSEAVSGWTRPDLQTETFVQNYTANFLAIVEHFEDRVRYFEMFNEPNDFAGGTSAQVPPLWCARQMESIYRAVKIDNGALTNPVRQNLVLVSPPLFTFSLTDGAGYFTEVWQAGRNQLEWNTIRNLTGSYPFDAIGYHIYVAEGLAESNADLETLTRRNLNGMWASVTALEGPNTQKKFYVSEFGFRPDFLSTTGNALDPVAQELQADRLEVAFNVYANDERVAEAHWFSLISFPGGEYGLYNQGPLADGNRRPAWFRFRDLATAGGGEAEVDSQLITADVPLWFRPNEDTTITLSYRNSGTLPWPAGGIFRLGAGSPATGNAFANQVPWVGGLNGGYSNGPLDARVFLPPPDISAGATATFSFLGRFPQGTAPGVYTFAARMLREGFAFFGDTTDRRLAVGTRGDSLLQNGSFESGTLAPWTLVQGSTDGVINAPDFFSVGPSHGTSFLGAAANFGQKPGIVAQQAAAIPGEWYAALSTIQTFREGGAPGDVAGRIGIDPAGGLDPAAPGIIWSVYTESPAAPTRIAAFAEASAETITVFLDARHAAPVWNVTAFDDTLLLGPGEGTDPEFEGWAVVGE